MVPWIQRRLYFNPRSPHGERRQHEPYSQQSQKFQSTLPAWGATCRSQFTGNHRRISIHAPRMGSDQLFTRKLIISVISIHAPRMGSDCRWNSSGPKTRNFNPRSPHGERLYWSAQTPETWYFNPRSPHGERQYSQSIQQ